MQSFNVLCPTCFNTNRAIHLADRYQ